ncbi:hypothetical protein H632_c658p1 [Helicosporidium sp. ATCC 50920]|nr:hypothetical protein H632_c658p1 [Helicosporidium sp. ATCC 50920]|eukprot:KDD75493.1 hypothetical protein H632_c658p1 [Helicosporidium sp. ATCC 50920]
MHAHAAHERSLAQAGRVSNSSFMVHPETLTDGLASPPASPAPSPFARSPWDVRVPNILIHSADVQVHVDSFSTGVEESAVSADSPPAMAPPLPAFLPSCQLIVKDATCCASSGLRVSSAAFEVALRCPHPMPSFPPGCLEASDLATGGYLSARIETETWGVGESGAEDDASEGADSDRATATQIHPGDEIETSPTRDSHPLLAISAFGVQVYPLAFQNYLLHARPLVVRLAWSSDDEACSLDVDATQGCEAFSLSPWLDFDSPSPAKALCALRPTPLHLLVGPAEWEERQAAALVAAMSASGVKVYDMAALSPEEVQRGRCSCGCPALDRKQAQADVQTYDELPAFVVDEEAADDAATPLAPGPALPECLCVCQPVAGVTIDAPTLVVDAPAAPGGEGADQDWMLPPQPSAGSELTELGTAPGASEVHWDAATMGWLNNNGTCAMKVADDIPTEYWRGEGEELEGFEEDC